MEKHMATRLAWATLAGSVILTVATWIAVFVIA